MKERNVIDNQIDFNQDKLGTRDLNTKYGHDQEDTISDVAAGNTTKEGK